MPSPTRATKGVAPARATRLGWLALLALGIPLALAACGGGGNQRRGALDIEMLDNFYKRDVTRVPAGTRVRFSNGGRAVHNAVAANGGWSTPLSIQSGDAATVTLSKPGVYRFYCTFHGTSDGQGMAGTIVVGDVRYETSESTTGRDLPVVRQASGVTRRVPQDYRTIQAAVNAASPGDLVLVGPGVYREEVKVTIPSLVIRGTDRNQVVVDGEAVENLTVRNAVANGLFWTGVTGYRASYVTASANGDYGIYAFGSRDGVFERSYASGSPDAGFYIGQCNPCNAVIDGVVSEGNALGYSGTNASDLDIVRSVFRRNWAGIVPNTGDYELLPPFRDVRIVGNLVQANGNRAAPGAHVEWSGFGNGIVLAGGNDALVQRNRVLDHPNHGILVTPNLDEHFWTSAGNQVRDNVISGSGRADLALAGPAGAGNCFSGNSVRSTVPVGLQAFQSCHGLRLPVRMDLSTTLQSLGPGGRGQPRRVPPQPLAGRAAGATAAADAWRRGRLGPTGGRHLPRPPRRPRPDRPAGAARRPARHLPQGAHRVRRPDPGLIRLAGDFRPLRLPAALRAVRGVDRAGPVGPRAPRRPQPRRHHRLGRRGAGGTVPRRDRLPRARAAEDPGLAADHHDRWWHRRLCAHPRHRRPDRWDRLALHHLSTCRPSSRNQAVIERPSEGRVVDWSIG